MEIKNQTFCGEQYAFAIPAYAFSITCNQCVFKEVDFSSKSNTQIFGVYKAHTYMCCNFAKCTFSENIMYTFIDCTFINCEFNGTFQASLVDCFFDDNEPYIPMTCPAEGDIIGWKVCHGQRNRTPYLVKLRIPYGVKRTSGFDSRKCRCERALVLDILHIDGTPTKETVVVSHFDKTFTYTKGQWIFPDSYDDDRRYICTNGIHFFMEQQEAINYYESELI